MKRDFLWRSRPIAALVATVLVATSAFAGDKPEILSRSDWGARPPIMAMVPNTPTRLTIHHTATRQNPRKTLAAKLRDLQAFSQSAGALADGRRKPAWPDVPYHFYIDVAGHIGAGRPVRFVGDTNTDYDPSGHIAIVVEGDFEIETPTPAEITALEDLLVYLAESYGLKADSIGSHRDYAATACPGKNLFALIPDIKLDVARRLQEGH